MKRSKVETIPIANLQCRCNCCEGTGQIFLSVKHKGILDKLESLGGEASSADINFDNAEKSLHSMRLKFLREQGFITLIDHPNYPWPHKYYRLTLPTRPYKNKATRTKRRSPL